LPLEVELLADPLQRRVAQRLAPAVDPQHPTRLGFDVGVQADEPFDALDGRADAVDLDVQPGQVGFGGPLERFDEQLVLRVEVVVDEPGGHAEALGHVGDPRGAEAALDHDLARDLQDLAPPFLDARPAHGPHASGGARRGRPDKRRFRCRRRCAAR
jgi:hypothetical protein